MERFKCFTDDKLTKRDKMDLDIFWLNDETLAESANLPGPEIIAPEITMTWMRSQNSLPRSRRI